MSHSNLHNVTTVYGRSYGAPEILDGLTPYDGEKADVFASAFILLAIFAVQNFSKNGIEQARSEVYKNFLEDGHLKDFWRSRRLTPSQELQELFAGMLQEDPSKRWTVQQIIDCQWMMNQEVPDPLEVTYQAYRVVELLKN